MTLLGDRLFVNFTSLNGDDIASVQISIPESNGEQYLTTFDVVVWADAYCYRHNLPCNNFNHGHHDFVKSWGGPYHEWKFLLPGSTILLEAQDNLLDHVREIDGELYLTLQAVYKGRGPF
jgi:hypothetical protein